MGGESIKPIRKRIHVYFLMTAYMQTSTFESGHHRLLHPENINSCIQQIEQAYLAK